MKHVLNVVLAIIFSLNNVNAEEPSVLFDLSGSVPNIEPEVERRELEIPDIDTENFELGVFAGVLNVESFGSNYVKGVNASFFLTEDVFVTVNAGFSTINDKVYRRLNLPLFGESGERSVQDRTALVGWNILPGEFFWLDKQAFTSDLYVLLGMGTLAFDEEEHGSIVAGIGVRMIPRDWFAIRLEAKISEYETNILGYKKFNHNVDIVSGVSFFF